MNVSDFLQQMVAIGFECGFDKEEILFRFAHIKTEFFFKIKNFLWAFHSFETEFPAELKTVLL